ncbi:MAG: hypothetical protein J5721_02180, partial [Lachnospiraceae bacterium]|nr:hypothetical protein [Lachnospiraceae bacterium]
MFLWLELIYHVSGFGWKFGNPLYTVFVALAWAAVETLVVLVVKGKAKKVFFLIFVWWSIVWTGAQITYLHIFKQPMLWEAVFRGGQDALTNYWREALTGFLQVSPYILLILIPGIVFGVLLRKKKLKLPKMDSLQVMRCLLAIVACVVACVIDMAVGKAADANYYENYTEFFDPLTVIEEMGVHPTLQRDTLLSISSLFNNGSYQAKKDNKPGSGNSGTGYSGMVTPQVTPGVVTKPGQTTDPDGNEGGDVEVTPTPEVFVPKPHVFALDQETLLTLSDNKKKSWLAEYILNET